MHLVLFGNLVECRKRGRFNGRVFETPSMVTGEHGRKVAGRRLTTGVYCGCKCPMRIKISRVGKDDVENQPCYAKYVVIRC